MAWTYGPNGRNENGLTPEEQAVWDQRAQEQMATLGSAWQPTYNQGYGGFQTQQELDAYRAKEAADAQTRQVWNGAAGRYMSAAESEAYGQGPNANPNIVFGGMSGPMQQNPVTGNYGGTTPAPVAPQPTAAQGGAAVPFTGGYSLGLGGSFGGTGTTSPAFSTSLNYTPPAPSAGSATATNPFLNIGLNAYSNTQKPYDPGYLNDVSKSLWNQATTNLNENVFPGMDSQAIAAGGYGGDRSYLAKGVAADRMNQSVFNAMAPQYQQDYNAWQNRALAGGQGAAGTGTGIEQLDLTQRLGLGNLGVSQYQADTQRQLGLSDADIKRYMAESNAAYQAGQLANPQYTNPWAAGIGAAGSLATLWNTLFGNTTTPKG